MEDERNADAKLKNSNKGDAVSIIFIKTNEGKIL